MPPPDKPRRVLRPNRPDIGPLDDAAQRQRILRDLLALGGSAFRAPVLQRWATDFHAPLKPLLSTLVLARIEWNPAEIGPLVRGAQGAFEAKHLRWQEVDETRQDGTVVWRKLASEVLPTPQLSEGPHGDGLARVSVLLFLDRAAQQGLEIKLAPGVRWVAPGDQFRDVVLAPGLRRFSRSDVPRVLAPFRVQPQAA